MAIKEIVISSKGTITLTPDAEGAEQIVVTPRLTVAEEAVLTYVTSDEAIMSLASLAADQGDQIATLNQRLTLQEQRLEALVTMIRNVTTQKDQAEPEKQIIHGAKLVTE